MSARCCGVSKPGSKVLSDTSWQRSSPRWQLRQKVKRGWKIGSGCRTIAALPLLGSTLALQAGKICAHRLMLLARHVVPACATCRAYTLCTLVADQTLLVLGDECASFVGWLAADEPLVQAYAACILANIAFVEKGQQKVLNARAIPPLMGLLRAAVDKKVRQYRQSA